MSLLRLVTGPSGSGKSRKLYNEILERVDKDRNRNYFFIVPDQSAMSVQKALVTASPARGILNIDVLGFGRLSHRILEETGQEETPVLDDTGMNLILRKVAADISDDLPVLGSKLSSPGYIAEVKSAISEFMQYGITPVSMDALIDESILRGALKGKLKDLKLLYTKFEEYISGNYITREEELDILCKAIPSSSILPDSVMVFDGFTGFTPVQMKVIDALMGRCSEMIFALESSVSEDVRVPVSEDELFYLSHKTAVKLTEMAKNAGLETPDPEQMSGLLPDRDIALLEANLFRKKRTAFAGEHSRSVSVSEMTDPASEVHCIGVRLRDLIRTKGYAYRDFAIVCGDAEGYAPYFQREFTDMGIPFFIDSVNGLSLNPLPETVRALLDIEKTDYSAASVIRFLKAGLTGIPAWDTDLLDNYIRQTGIRGYKAWHSVFARKIKRRRADEDYMKRINEIREKIVALTAPFEEAGKGAKKKDTTEEYVKRLYDTLIGMEAPEKIRTIKRSFEDKGDALRKREYENVWKLFVELFDKMFLLCGSSEVSLETFSDMVSSGISEMRVPQIPLSVDRVLIGDIVRSRLDRVRVLFFAGVNDGNIPRAASGKGIISDLDREFLLDKGVELSPVPRQQMYIQRQYLYMNICKPSDELLISYCRVRPDGKSARPSYIIPLVKKILPYTYPPLRPESESVSSRVSTERDSLGVLAGLMRDYSDLKGNMESAGEVFALYAALSDEDGYKSLIRDSVFRRYQSLPLRHEIVKLMYTDELSGSVSSLETYAGCPYRYFLNFGLDLIPVEAFEIRTSDRGELAHDILKRFTDRLKDDGLDWGSSDHGKAFDDDYARRVIPELAMVSAVERSGELYRDSKRNEYNIERLARLVIRSVLFIRDQLSAGSFRPVYSEKAFDMDMALPDKKGLKLRGFIDRIDMASDSGKEYVQMVDYKSGDKDIDLSMLLDGRQIQLPLYMYWGREERGWIPASMLYFHIQDPFEDLSEESEEESAEDAIRAMMKPSGEILSSEKALALLDRSFEGMPPQTASKYLHVSTKKDGEFTSSSRVLDEKSMNRILDESISVVRREACEILDGNISLTPFSGTCRYCSYSAACGFDKKIPGYVMRTENKKKRDEVLEELTKDRSEEGGDTDVI